MPVANCSLVFATCRTLSFGGFELWKNFKSLLVRGLGLIARLPTSLYSYCVRRTDLKED
jgi:hypothetical protein